MNAITTCKYCDRENYMDGRESCIGCGAPLMLRRGSITYSNEPWIKAHGTELTAESFSELLATLKRDASELPFLIPILRHGR